MISMGIFCLLVNILWYIEGNFKYINSINSKFEIWLNDTASILFDLFDSIILYYGKNNI